uniref:Uncharacterized protein n=1 Tax=Biomphalaria glabrata TaxID=6526 RepID=A0A2C9JLM9_BIOGL
MSIINVDDEFSSYDEVEHKIQELQDKEKFKLWKRDSRTIAAAIKRMPKRIFSPDVKYNELLYCCVYGGREKKDELRSMRQKCPYQIKFRCTQDGQRLRVVSITPNHNHGPIDYPEAEVIKQEEKLDDLVTSSCPQTDDTDLMASGEVDIEDSLDDCIGDQLNTTASTDFTPSSVSSHSTKLFSNISFKQPKLKVILDVDTGIDDSHAIMLALAHPNVEILAITCVNGNVNVDLVCQNTLRVLKACDREDVSDFGCKCRVSRKVVYMDDIAKSAMLISIREITVVALAPLTNLALAMRLDSTVGRKIKDLYVMGGNIEARGRISACAEFNFYNDPEAAQVVLKEFINITILPYEVCRRFHLPWDFFDIWTNSGSKVSNFVRRSVLESAKPARAAGRDGYRSCDGYCMALVIDRSVVLSAEPVYCTVELSGQYTRGQMIVDWDGLFQQPCNALVVKELDIEKIQGLFILMVRPQTSAVMPVSTVVKSEYDSNNNT